VAPGNQLVAALTAAIALSAVTACEPPPPRLDLTVTSDAPGADDDPGDGLCASAAAAGACTLPAAIDEANTAPNGADVTLPPGDYLWNDLTVTGNVHLIGESRYTTTLGAAHVTVAAGATFRVHGIGTKPPDLGSHPLSFRVEGTLVLERSLVDHTWLLSGQAQRPALDIAATGTALLTDSIVVADDDVAAVVNAGRLVAVRSGLAPLRVCSPDECYGTDVAVHTTATGETHLAASATHAVGTEPTVLARCSGTPPVSHGYVHLEAPCGGTPSIGDSTGPSGLTYDALGTITVQATSPLVDAIPLGDPLCDTTAFDLHGVVPRGGDGDGDGEAGCDIGGVERWHP
jgi:hypothetical protein